MARPSWHLDRRTFLRGAGLSLALPWLEAMAKADPPAERPKRFCAFFFGNGVAIPKQILRIQIRRQRIPRQQDRL